eukprot:2288236-Prorocentrum_lima.AAC.1
MTSSLVGSEMCIRDRCLTEVMPHCAILEEAEGFTTPGHGQPCSGFDRFCCLLYTSDAADDM